MLWGLPPGPLLLHGSEPRHQTPVNPCIPFDFQSSDKALVNEGQKPSILLLQRPHRALEYHSPSVAGGSEGGQDYECSLHMETLGSRGLKPNCVRHLECGNEGARTPAPGPGTPRGCTRCPALPSGTPLRQGGGNAERVTPTAKGNLQSALSSPCKDRNAAQLTESHLSQLLLSPVSPQPPLCILGEGTWEFRKLFQNWMLPKCPCLTWTTGSHTEGIFP